MALGASPRAALSLMHAAQAAAVLAGRDYVTPDDVQRLAPAALAHRMMLARQELLERRDPETVVAALLAEVPAPVEGPTAAG